jgi:putative transposase
MVAPYAKITALRRARVATSIMPVTNPVESTFATVRLRTTRTKGCLSRRTALTMVFRLCLSAQRRWRRLDGPARLGEVVRGVRFVDGEPRIQDAA